MRRASFRSAAVLSSLALLAGLTVGVTPGARAASGQPSSSGGALELKVMSLNMFYGGDDLDTSTGGFCAVPNGCTDNLRRIEQMILATGADVVGTQEAERNDSRVARAMGWYASDRAHVISRYPIIDPPHGNGVYVFVETSPGRVVAVANVHMPSDPYGPFLVRDGGNAAQLTKLEDTVRLPAIQTQLRVLPALAARGIPVFLTGDFNSPSYLDWTPAVAAVRPDVHFPFVWPVSKALADAGMRDSYREVYPDPVAVPGFTWTPGSPEADPHEVFDRIDWVLHAGPSKALASTIVGETGGADVGYGFTPYPSDHRGVLSTFAVHPAVSPVLVAVSTRRLYSGDPLTVAFHAPGRAGERVGLVRHGGSTVLRAVSTGAGAPADGSVVLSTVGLGTGRYDAVLVSTGGRVLSTSTSLWAYPQGTKPSVSTDRSTYRVGQPIGVSWAAAPGMALDWIGVFRCYPGGCAGNGGYLLYWYTSTRVQGRGVIGPGKATQDGNESWPLPAGEYVVRLLPDDGYVSVAVSKPFTIKD